MLYDIIMSFLIFIATAYDTYITLFKWYYWVKTGKLPLIGFAKKAKLLSQSLKRDDYSTNQTFVGLLEKDRMKNSQTNGFSDVYLDTTQQNANFNQTKTNTFMDVLVREEESQSNRQNGRIK